MNHPEIHAHELTLVTQSDGLMLYAFTFTSCVAAGENLEPRT